MDSEDYLIVTSKLCKKNGSFLSKNINKTFVFFRGFNLESNDSVFEAEMWDNETSKLKYLHQKCARDTWVLSSSITELWPSELSGSHVRVYNPTSDSTHGYPGDFLSGQSYEHVHLSI
jgi:cobalamin-dependent methionine synthase I